MRDIEFRTWNTMLKRMFDVYQIEFDAGLVSCTCRENGTKHIFSFMDIKIIQYTGLKDKNGVDGYEGDIVSQKKNCLYDDGRKFNEVAFIGDQFVSGPCSLLNAVNSFDAKVIGNIYENQDLLEGVSNGK